MSEFKIKNFEDLSSILLNENNLTSHLILDIDTDTKFFNSVNLNTFPFPWHLKDSQRSLLSLKITNPKFEFSYRQIIEPHLSNIKKLINKDKYRTTMISIWDNKYINYSIQKRIPCLSLLYFEKDKLYCIWRKRDVCRRLIPNLYALFKFYKEIWPENNNIKILDITLKIVYDKKNYEKLKNWLISNKYNNVKK